MAQYKITLFDQYSRDPIAEIIESQQPPQIQHPIHTLSDGRCGLFLKLEVLLEASPNNTYRNLEE